jgi:hypothetical protein
MEKKSKFTKLPEGYAKGCETYGLVCRPKGGNSESKAQELKSRAAQRILMLMKNGSQADRMTRDVEPITDKQQLDDLEFRNRLAESPKIVQFAYWRSKLEELKKELIEFETTENKKKIDVTVPTIKRQIEAVENTMRELFDDIKKERRIISKTPNTERE